MSITAIPARAVGSLGPTKADTRAVQDVSGELAAAEWNVAADTIIDLVTEVGLSDGSTVGSLREGVASGVRSVRAEVQTTDASNTQIYLDSDTADAGYDIHIIASQNGGAEYAFFRYAAVRKDFGGATIDSKEMHAPTGSGIASGWAVTITTGAGDTLEILVAGAAAKTVDWVAHITRIAV